MYTKIFFIHDKNKNHYKGTLELTCITLTRKLAALVAMELTSCRIRLGADFICSWRL
jgi:hypothetical protein